MTVFPRGYLFCVFSVLCRLDCTLLVPSVDGHVALRHRRQRKSSYIMTLTYDLDIDHY